jgi:hypothetical protein
MKKTGLLLSYLATFYFTTSSFAQESVNSSGADAIGSGGKIAFSIGQVFYTTNSAINGSIAQGIQQAYEIFSLGMVPSSLEFNVTIFPNPTSENITIELDDTFNQKLSYQFFDEKGSQLNEGKIVEHKTELTMKNLPSAIYFLKILDQELKIIRSFKIIKN